LFGKVGNLSQQCAECVDAGEVDVVVHFAVFLWFCLAGVAWSVLVV
jgi:hypothetical protein